MNAPLYLQEEPAAKCEKDGNKGLWFDRFYDQYDPHSWEILKPVNNDEKKGNSYWLKEYFHNKKAGNDKQLQHYATQQRKLAETLQGNSHIFTAKWHFVTGMGNPHPVENGFAWHPTLGVPYLTGAAVKGLVRNYIENYLDASAKDRQALLLNWFGSTDKNPKTEDYKTQTGNLIFFDALPVDEVTLVQDIMTPHMGDWYQKGAENPNQPTTVPADWHDPVPISFLATKNINLQFSYALRQYPQDTSAEAIPRDNINLKEVQQVLTLALEHLGAGGKTTTGYGAMSHNEKAEIQMQEQARQNEAARVKQDLSEEALALYELWELLEKDKTTNKKQAGGATSSQLAELLKSAQGWEQPDKTQAAGLAEEIYNWHGWGPKKKRSQKEEKLKQLRG